nr:BEN domain-containing protein 5-like [Parasteatoda tepidariorum]
MLFDVETLARSSVTGHKSNASKNSTVKPALDPKKLAYIRKLVRDRIVEEGAASELEMEKRFSKINSIIAEKIATLNRTK